MGHLSTNDQQKNGFGARLQGIVASLRGDTGADGSFAIPAEMQYTARDRNLMLENFKIATQQADAVMAVQNSQPGVDFSSSSVHTVPNLTRGGAAKG